MPKRGSVTTNWIEEASRREGAHRSESAKPTERGAAAGTWNRILGRRVREKRSKRKMAKPGEYVGRSKARNVYQSRGSAMHRPNITGPTISHQGLSAVNTTTLLSDLGTKVVPPGGLFKLPEIKSQARRRGRPIIGSFFG